MSMYRDDDQQTLAAHVQDELRSERRRKTLQEYLDGRTEADPYFAALWKAVSSAEDESEFDRRLEAFPNKREWKRQQKQPAGGRGQA